MVRKAFQTKKVRGHCPKGWWKRCIRGNKVMRVRRSGRCASGFKKRCVRSR